MFFVYNLLLISPDFTVTKTYLDDFVKKNKILPANLLIFSPEETGWPIAEVRRIAQLVNSSYAERTVFVLSDFHTAKDAAQNAFLKTLEEHQENVIFVLTASSVVNILPTIKSRCEIKKLKFKCQMSNVKSNSNEENSKQIKEIIQKAKEKKVFLLSAELKLTPSKKKEQANEFLDVFLENAAELLKIAKDKVWLSGKVKKALEAKRLINNNFVDPELALDQIFL